MNILPKESIKLIKGEEFLTLYQFGTNVAKHYFCKNVVYTLTILENLIQMVLVSILVVFDEIDSFSVNSDVLDNK